MPKKVRRKKQKQNPFLSIGIGLFLVGIAVILFASGNTKSNPSSGAEDFSVFPVEVNFPAPELSRENISGRTESLADYRGKVVLVNNWATCLLLPETAKEKPQMGLVIAVARYQAQGK